MRITSRPAIAPASFGRLALRVVEVGGHRDDGARHCLPEIFLRGLLEFLQHHRRDLRRGVVLVHDLHAHVAVRRGGDRVGDHLHLFADFVEPAAHEPLDREHRVLRFVTACRFAT
jgi:hypothetical protein